MPKDLKNGLRIRAIRRSDNAVLERIIHTALAEFDADGPGFASEDAETPRLYETYRPPGRFFYAVVTPKGRVVGGGGIGPLDGGRRRTCELRKMYFLKTARGKGMGRRLLALCLKNAKRSGYTRCYLETLKHMKAARRLYEKAGFVRTCRMGRTAHCGCDTWYIKRL